MSTEYQTMQPYQQRVIDEKSALDIKISALSDFVKGSIFPDLSIIELVDMLLQLEHMTAYSNDLGRRIGRF